MHPIAILFLGILIGGLSSLFGIWIAQRRENKKTSEEEFNWIQQQIDNGFLVPATEEEIMNGTLNERPLTPIHLNKLMRDFEIDRVQNSQNEKPTSFE